MVTSRPAAGDLGPCPLCGRAMVEGPSIDRHHWVPRSHGGREQAAMHQVCHSKVHAMLSEAELARNYSNAQALRCHPEIARFIAWVQRKPPEWNTWHRKARPR